MAFTVNPLTYIISIPKTDLTFISGTLYELDTNDFRLQLKAWEASVEGMVQLVTHVHNTEVTVAGVVYARTVSILPPYSIEFEDGQYTVILKGSNNNIFDVASNILEQNQVQVIPTNSAGLIVVTQDTGTLLTPEQSANFEKMRKYHTNKMEIDGDANQLIVYEDNGVDIAARYDLADATGNPNSTVIFKRTPV